MEMENRGQKDSQELKMQSLIDRFLRVRSASGAPAAEPGLHLDDDSLAAFAEGNLSEREARPVVSHIVDCSFCRHITAELVCLDFAFAEDEALNPLAENRAPSRVSEVLSGLLSRIFGAGDDVVFALNEAEKEDKSDAEDKENEN